MCDSSSILWQCDAIAGSYSEILQAAKEACRTDADCAAFEIMRTFSQDKSPEFRDRGQTWADKIDASIDAGGWLVYKLHKREAGEDFSMHDTEDLDWYASNRDEEIYNFKALPSPDVHERYLTRTLFGHIGHQSGVILKLCLAMEIWSR